MKVVVAEAVVTNRPTDQRTFNVVTLLQLQTSMKTITITTTAKETNCMALRSAALKCLAAPESRPFDPLLIDRLHGNLMTTMHLCLTEENWMGQR